MRASTSPTGTAKIGRKTALSLSPLVTEGDEGIVASYTGQLTEASGPNVGSGIPNKTIHFFIQALDATLNPVGNPQEVATAVTDINGNYTISYTWTSLGIYQYQTSYLGD